MIGTASRARRGVDPNLPAAPATMPAPAPAFDRRGVVPSLSRSPASSSRRCRSTTCTRSARRRSASPRSLTFVAGGWRELHVAAAQVRLVRRGSSPPGSRSSSRVHRSSSLSEYRYEVLYTFGTWATWYTLARRHDGARWLARALIVVDARRARRSGSRCSRPARPGSISAASATSAPCRRSWSRCCRCSCSSRCAPRRTSAARAGALHRGGRLPRCRNS